MKSGNACCHQVKNILTSSLLPKNIKTKIYIIVILRVCAHACVRVHVCVCVCVCVCVRLGLSH
jgi:hypothetical protein